MDEVSGLVTGRVFPVEPPALVSQTGKALSRFPRLVSLVLACILPGGLTSVVAQRMIPFDPICGFDYSPEKHAERLRQLELIKAALLYRCLEQVQWPGRAGEASEITLGILGQSGFAEAANGLAGKTVAGRRLAVKSLSDASEAAECQLVFLSISEKRRVPKILEGLADRPILTVSEVPGFTTRGGMISLRNKGPKVVLDVNPEAAEKVHITMDPKLIKLAESVNRSVD